MTLVNEYVPVVTWTEPEGIAVRGTLVVIPGRGEQPGHYERFGRRIAADGYRVHAVTDNGEIVLAARLLGTTAPANEAVAERARQGLAGWPGPRITRRRRPDGHAVPRIAKERSRMPVEFISATHTTPTTEATAGGRRSGFDVARPFEIICEIEPPIRPDLPAGIRQGNTATGHGAASVSRVDCLLAWQRIEVLS